VVAGHDGGRASEMVKDGETSYLVPPRDERALAIAIVKLRIRLHHKMGEG